MRGFLVFAALVPALAIRTAFQHGARPRDDSKRGCDKLPTCGQCTGVSFCMWHGTDKTCKSETQVSPQEAYSFFQGSCDHKAGDWLESKGGTVEINAATVKSALGAEAGAGALNAHQMSTYERQQFAKAPEPEEDPHKYEPLMMQPPHVANEDEAHIFQSGFPRPDYGFGELGYKLQGKDMQDKRDYSNTPRSGCDTPMSGCLEKPVIVPQGDVHYGATTHLGQAGDEEKEEPSPKFKQTLKSLEGYDKPVWKDEYDGKNEI